VPIVGRPQIDGELQQKAQRELRKGILAVANQKITKKYLILLVGGNGLEPLTSCV
jgi:hypothetical protein